MQSVSDDDVWKKLLEKPRFELAAKGVFRLGRCSASRKLSDHIQVNTTKNLLPAYTRVSAE